MPFWWTTIFPYASICHFFLSYLISIYQFTVHVIIATPGRIYDLMKKELADTKQCQMIIMDEVSCHFQHMSIFRVDMVRKFIKHLFVLNTTDFTILHIPLRYQGNFKTSVEVIRNAVSPQCQSGHDVQLFFWMFWMFYFTVTCAWSLSKNNLLLTSLYKTLCLQVFSLLQNEVLFWLCINNHFDTNDDFVSAILIFWIHRV